MSETPAIRYRDTGTRTDMVNVDPQTIRIDKGHNPRDYRLQENRAHLDSLKQQILAAPGVRNPLLVRMEGDQLVLVDGECRLRACLELSKEGHDIKRVPTILVKAGTEAERLMIALESNTGKQLSAWESGTGFKKLVGFGWTVEEIAARFGTTAANVAKGIELSDAPEEIKQQLSEQAISPAFAVKAIKKARGNAAAAVEETTKAVAAKKASGKKGPVKVEKKKATNPFEELCRTIIKQAIRDKDFGVGTIEEVVAFKTTELEYKWIDIDSKLMLKMAKLVARDTL